MIGKMKAFAGGLLLGLLVAPRAGRESRRRIADLVDRFFETGSSELDRLETELTGADPADPEEPEIDEDSWDAPDEDLGG
ncbi:MAG TPA: hypothetical protein VM778_12265 [Gemmatimonadota bacterium]|nr:hypothetical protein [Gemmatimonadota bacterium]